VGRRLLDARAHEI
jgi:hypothetical protein